MKCIFRKKELSRKYNSLLLFFMIIEILVPNQISSFTTNLSLKKKKIDFMLNTTKLNLNNKFNNTQTNNITNGHIILEHKIPVLEISKENEKVNIKERVINPNVYDMIPKTKLIKAIPLISEFQKNKIKKIEKYLKNALYVNDIDKTCNNFTDFNNSSSSQAFVLKKNKFKSKSLKKPVFKTINNRDISKKIKNMIGNITIDINKKKFLNQTNIKNNIYNLTKNSALKNHIKNLTSDINQKSKQEISLLTQGKLLNHQFFDNVVENKEIKNLLKTVKLKKNSKLKKQDLIKINQIPYNNKNNTHSINTTDVIKTPIYITELSIINNLIAQSTSNNTLVFQISNRNKSDLFVKDFTERKKIGKDRKNFTNVHLIKKSKNLNSSSLLKNNKNVDFIKNLSIAKNISFSENLNLQVKNKNFIMNESILNDIDFKLDIDDIPSSDIENKIQSKIKNGEKLQKNTPNRKSTFSNEGNGFQIINENSLKNKTKELEVAIEKTVNLISDTEKIYQLKDQKSEIEFKKIGNNLDLKILQNNNQGNNTVPESKIDKKIDSLNKLIENYEILSNITYSILKNKEKNSKNNTNSLELEKGNSFNRISDSRKEKSSFEMSVSSQSVKLNKFKYNF